MNTPGIAHSPILWLAVFGVFVVIAVQSVVYLRAAKRAAPAAEMSHGELVAAFRTGAVSALGPSLAVVFVAISLLSVFGTPAVLARIGLIGSAAFETLSARTAAETAGVELGGAGYDNAAFALVLFTMSVGGAAWMVSTLIFTPLLRRTDDRIRALNPAIMAIVPSAAMIAAFSYLGLDEMQKSRTHLVTFVTGAAAMLGLQLAGARLKVRWLKEWSLGIAMVVALTAAGITL
ncbi:uncharacterized protein DUF5058 [Halopolyspora algeriensis]|uniref:Uncharacterized protein DUF5058 n=1 Tax=Halopolyspora algeriensis TaxID=1500506 RepID=A0A368W135_9ACTN|nr:DUF5058 family protein [Halopolyspora algeriensis]RCW45708.1 uncharacterized protein DUF5058 [Halopolyspora algeriensis]TQM54092.1 uncharacterized protein DUF5058 [Halopolyspora algeriensis]